MKLLALPLMLALALSGSPDKPKRPKLSVKVNPAMAISPARVVASADVNGGPDDFEEFYCAAIEWDWGDDTRSNKSEDCDPYEAGKSQIKRRFTADHASRHAYETGSVRRWRSIGIPSSASSIIRAPRSLAGAKATTSFAPASTRPVSIPRM